MSDAVKYGKKQNKQVDELVKNHQYDKITKHVVFDSEKVELPEGVTKKSLDQHIGLINNLVGVVDTAAAKISRDLYETDNEVNEITASLNLGDLRLNATATLQTKLGEDTFYGVTNTIVDYVHSNEATQWLEEQRLNNEEKARKLFS